MRHLANFWLLFTDKNFLNTRALGQRKAVDAAKFLKLALSQSGNSLLKILDRIMIQISIEIERFVAGETSHPS